MFQKSSAVVGSTTGNPNSNTKPDPDPHLGSTSGSVSASNYINERITSPSFKDKHYVNHLHSNRPREESKSQNHNRLRNSNSHSSSTQQSHIVHSSATTSASSNNQEVANNQSSRNSHHQTFNPRQGGNNFVRSSTNPQIYQNPTVQSQRQDASSNFEAATRLVHNGSRPAESPAYFSSTRASQSYSARQRSPFSSTLRDESRASQSSQHQEQQDRDDPVTVIQEELEELADAFKESELETLGSLEKNLPVELSFLIRQQAYCMARMNYLDRQIRELKEAKQHNVPHQSNHQHQQLQVNHRGHNINGLATTHIKHGNGFIPSDDSGGEYSRATISDEDELSSLLDQIAKSVKPERNMNQSISVNHHQLLQQQQLNSRANYSVISSQPQQYAIINPGQLHATHQTATAVPVFVMGSPIAVAHPSSISSNILPGVHFQPEPRYNQYYEDFYTQNNGNAISSSNNNSSSTTHSMMNTRQINGFQTASRPQPNTSQFDTSITAIEQLVMQKERRQIRSQLKSADNWLKMRSTTMCNLNENFGGDKREMNDGQANGQTTLGSHEQSKSNQMSSTVAPAAESSNSVIEGNVNNR